MICKRLGKEELLFFVLKNIDQHIEIRDLVSKKANNPNVHSVSEQYYTEILKY